MARTHLDVFAQPDRSQHIAKFNEHDTALDNLEAGSVSFKPGRMLYVAQSWPAAVDPAVFFTTISAALTQAAALTPTEPNKVCIRVYPGSYTEALTLVSNVAMIAEAPGDGVVEINGNISWTAGSGVNAGQAASTEVVVFDGFLQNSGFTFTINTSAKIGNSLSLFYSHGSHFRAMNCTGQGTASTSGDEWFFYNANFLSTNTNTFKDVGTPTSGIGVEFVGCRMRSTQVQGTTVLRASGGTTSGATTIALTTTTAGNPTMIMSGVSRVNLVTAAASCTFISNSIHVAALSGAGTFDLRGANYGGNAHISGITGTCDRSNWTGTTASTSTGNNTISISPPYPNTTDMKVMATQDTGTATAFTVPSASYAVNQFVLNDPSAGGNTFSYVITKD
jgi:hypothetical protein